MSKLIYSNYLLPSSVVALNHACLDLIKTRLLTCKQALLLLKGNYHRVPICLFLCASYKYNSYNDIML